MPKIVVLDGFTLNPGDLDWTQLQSQGEVHIFDRTPPELLLERASGAEILIVNKQVINGDAMAALPNLKLIAVSATGYNNVDTAAAQEKNIAVANVSGYSTPAVVQHVFALLLGLINQVDAHHQSVQRGDWASSPDFSYTLSPLLELTSLRLGIYGFGRIGQAVAKAAMAFGMEVYPQTSATRCDARGDLC